jgi:hypothetical protein
VPNSKDLSADQMLSIVCNLAPFKMLFPSMPRGSSHRYGHQHTDEKQYTTERSQELTSWNEADRTTFGGMVSTVIGRTSPTSQLRTESRARDEAPSLPMPQGIHRAAHRSSSSGPYRWDGGILVTKEVDRVVVMADQVTMSSDRSHSVRTQSMRASVIGRDSDGSLECLAPPSIPAPIA